VNQVRDTKTHTMSNKNVVAVFAAGLALLLAAFWAGLYVVRQEPPKPAPAAAESAATRDASPPPQPEAPPQPSPDARYVVQVSSYGTADKANEFRAQLKKQYFAAYTQGPTKDDPLYHVCIGPYTDYDQARQLLNQLASQGFKGVMIVPFKSE
jgi:cell division septation protein DedD